MIEKSDGLQAVPFRPKPSPDQQGEFRRILSLGRGIQLSNLLSRGTGACVSLDERVEERAAIEAQGYKCRNLTNAEAGETIIPSSAAAVVEWRPRELPAVEQLIGMASALLEPGGVLVGRLSGDEIAELKRTLLRHGFRDIEVLLGRHGPARGMPAWILPRYAAVYRRMREGLAAAAIFAKIGVRFLTCPRVQCNELITKGLADFTAFMARKTAVDMQCTSDI